MLVLSRKLGERIVIGDSVVLEVVDIQRGQVRLGVRAPADVKVLRGELIEMRVGYCSWCSDPTNPSPEHHPGGQAEHVS